MKQRIEVRSQAEFDACIAVGNIAIVIDCHVEARGNSSVEARENSSVVAWENSSVVAWGNVFIRLFSALKITASASVLIMLHGKAKSITGGKRVKAAVPTTATKWCAHWGVKVTKGIALVFKGVDDDYSTDHARQHYIFYTPGTKPQADDWDGGREECGGGLHFSPIPKMALEFNPQATRFVACPVRLKDISVHTDARYPQKIKAKGCCAPVYEVDKNGKRL